MRIIGNIEHSALKITVFKMDNRLSVKFENGLYEQTYKFRMADHLESFTDVEKLVDGTFIQAVNEELKRMHQIRNAALGRFLPVEEEDEFEEII